MRRPSRPCRPLWRRCSNPQITQISQMAGCLSKEVWQGLQQVTGRSAGDWKTAVDRKGGSARKVLQVCVICAICGSEKWWPAFGAGFPGFGVGSATAQLTFPHRVLVTIGLVMFGWLSADLTPAQARHLELPPALPSELHSVLASRPAPGHRAPPAPIFFTIHPDAKPCHRQFMANKLTVGEGS